jgi:release factor glutamine methyltransferase
MKGNSPAITLEMWLSNAEKALTKAGIPSARLDALILLEDTLNKDRSWILAHPEHNLSASIAKILDRLVNRRKKGEPLAYIRGFIEFYGRKFSVTPAVLIPRPETEAVIELAKRLDIPKDPDVIDVGTGSGCIAISLKLERPSWSVYATDISKKTLSIARRNAKALKADVSFHEADLLNLDILPPSPSLITANLPYVDTSWETQGIDYEPPVALYASDDGLEIIKRLVIQASTSQDSGAYIVLEADPCQHDDIIAYAHLQGYSWYASEGYVIVLQKS